jgi:hypothetical protein
MLKGLTYQINEAIKQQHQERERHQIVKGKSKEKPQ